MKELKVLTFHHSHNKNFLIFAFYSVAYKTLPSLDHDIFTQSGKRGFIASWYKHVGGDSLIPHDEVLETGLIDETNLIFAGSLPQGLTETYTLELRGHLKPRPYDCIFEFGLSVAGRAKVRNFSIYIVFNVYFFVYL